MKKKFKNYMSRQLNGIGYLIDGSSNGRIDSNIFSPSMIIYSKAVENFIILNYNLKCLPYKYSSRNSLYEGMYNDKMIMRIVGNIIKNTCDYGEEDTIHTRDSINMYKAGILFNLFIATKFNIVVYDSAIEADIYGEHMLSNILKHCHMYKPIYDIIKENLGVNFNKDSLHTVLIDFITHFTASFYTNDKMLSDYNNIVKHVCLEYNSRVEREEDLIYDTKYIKPYILLKNIKDTINRYKINDGLCKDLSKVINTHYPEENKKWLLDSVLEFDEDIRPYDILDEIYETYKDEYNYTGRVFHGIYPINPEVTNIKEVLSMYKGPTSFSKDIDITCRFATSSRIGYGAIIVTESKGDNVDIHKMIEEKIKVDKVYNNSDRLSRMYSHEKEVLMKIPEVYDIINLVDIKYDTIGLDYLKCNKYINTNVYRELQLNKGESTANVHEHTIPGGVHDVDLNEDYINWIETNFSNRLIVINKVLKDHQWFINNNFIDFADISNNIPKDYYYIYKNNKYHEIIERLTNNDKL